MNSLFSLILGAPLFFCPVLYGLAPDFASAVLACILAAIAYLVLGYQGLSSKGTVPIFIFIALSALCAFCGSFAVSHNQITGLGISVSLIYALALWIRRDESLQQLVIFAAISGAWVSACVFLGAYAMFPASITTDVAMRNPNILALHCAMVLPFAIHHFHATGGHGAKAFYGICAVVLTAAVLLSGSTSAALALTAAAAAVLPRRRRGLWLAAAAAMVLASAVVKWSLDPVSAQARASWLLAAFNIFMDHPLIGADWKGGFFSLYPLYKSAAPAAENTWMAHNVYLEILARWGLLGAVLAARAAAVLRKHCLMNNAWKASLLVIAIMGLWDSHLLLLPNILTAAALAAVHMGNIFLEKGGEKASCSMLLGALLALPLLFLNFKLAASHYQLLRAGAFIGASAYMPEAQMQGYRFIVRSLRWTARNPDAWSDLGKLELDYTRHAPPRLWRAIWAERNARAVNPANKTHLKNLKILYSVAKYALRHHPHP